jgi:hypothetical protein
MKSSTLPLSILSSCSCVLGLTLHQHLTHYVHSHNFPRPGLGSPFPLYLYPGHFTLPLVALPPLYLETRTLLQVCFRLHTFHSLNIEDWEFKVRQGQSLHQLSKTVVSVLPGAQQKVGPMRWQGLALVKRKVSAWHKGTEMWHWRQMLSWRQQTYSGRMRCSPQLYNRSRLGVPEY